MPVTAVNQYLGGPPPHYAFLAITALMTSSSLLQPVVEVGGVHLERMGREAERLTQEHRGQFGDDLLAGIGRIAELREPEIAVQPMRGFRGMGQLMRPDPIETARVLEPRDGRHVDLVHGWQIIGFRSREDGRDVDGIENRLYVQDGLGGWMLGHGLRIGEEAVGQALDLAGVEDAVGFLEAEDAGLLGVIIPLPVVILAARVFPALTVIDDDRGLLALAHLRVQRIGLRQRHPEGRAMARHDGAHGQQEVVDPLVGFPAHAQGARTATCSPGLAPRQDAALDDADDFVRDDLGGIEFGRAGSGHGGRPFVWW